ncbi:class I SAM-dependent methyltransferase [Thermodesulfobacteriota bacterium]
MEIKRIKRNHRINAQLDVLDRFFPKDKNISILEIGGAPGQYLAYMAKHFSYRIHALDYSGIGCEKTRENFSLLNLNGPIYQRDLLADDISDLPGFDIVYSLGFIEHFADPAVIVERHVALLKPGGLLLIGMPNFLGMNYWLNKKLAPEKLSRHNLHSMDIKHWHRFQRAFKLKPLFQGYIGGFSPSYKYEKKTAINLCLNIFTRTLRVIAMRLKFLANINSKYWSGYALGLYRKME